MAGTAPNWQLVAVMSSGIRQFSYGRVSSVHDLYSPRIFGPMRDLACECGKYVGEKHAEIICDRCGVKIVADSAEVRRERMGHISLACPIRHPVDESVIIEDFPVAPISYRRREDGSLTGLGRKYEVLIQRNDEAARSLPERNTEDYFLALGGFDANALVSEIEGLIGRAGEGARPTKDSLLSLLFAALLDGKLDIAPLVRSCGLGLRIEATI